MSLSLHTKFSSHCKSIVFSTSHLILRVNFSARDQERRSSANPQTNAPGAEIDQRVRAAAGAKAHTRILAERIRISRMKTASVRIATAGLPGRNSPARPFLVPEDGSD
jgi:hypothetical protein